MDENDSREFLDTCKNSKLGASAPELEDGGDSSNGTTSETNKTWSFFGWNSHKNNNRTVRNHLSENNINPSDEFKLKIPHDPHLSPYRASDDLLKRLPPVKILVSFIIKFYHLISL